MIIKELVKTPPGSWLSLKGGTGSVISSRVRLARNVAGVPFPGWASEETRINWCERLRAAIARIPGMADAHYLDMGDLDPVDKAVLRERHLISPEMAEKGKGSAVVVADQEQIAIMINEEDHLRLQAIQPGLSIEATWARLNALDSELEEQLDYAFSSGLGYLTACPTNVGTGLRASVMMHLSGLRLMGEVDGVIKALDKMDLTVRGLQGEGTEAAGDMFQVSNQTTLGESEDAIIGQLLETVREVSGHEENARLRLLEQKKAFVQDHVYRSFGLLTHARLLSSGEVLDLLSGLRLGLDCRIVKNLTVNRLNRLMVLTQAGHLQRIMGRAIEPEERDAVRAQILRQRLRNVTLAS